ncbi:calcium-binding protein CP1 [Typha latifolia]|uniref:calcium-binding protein CP1 n=1 Tax=Typha latifolia TaxID=4733 RepID=UPI003C2D20AB
MCPSGRYRDDRAADSPDLRPAFDILDADRDGRISREDLKAFYSGRTAAAPITDDDIASMISAADADRNGFVDYSEFERVLSRRIGSRGCGGAVSVMEEAFRVMDRDGDGMVGFEDLKGYLEWAGMPVADEEIRVMIRMGAGDESGGVSFEALAKILAADFAKGV